MPNIDICNMSGPKCGHMTIYVICCGYGQYKCASNEAKMERIASKLSEIQQYVEMLVKCKVRRNVSEKSERGEKA